MKKIIIISAWILFIAGVIYALFYTGIINRNKTCESVDIAIDYNKSDMFFNKEDIQSYIFKDDTIVGRKLSDISVGMIENLILSNPYVYNVDVYKTMNGILKINVIQRKPIIRIYNTKNQQYYIDDKGVKMPLDDKYPMRVLIANGFIDSIYKPFLPSNHKQRDDTLNLQKDTLMYNLFKIAKFINNNEFIKAMIEEVFVTRDHEFELIPKVGNQLIILGDANDLDEKFEKLFSIYKEGISENGWDKYKIINLKFKNQVVCTKN